MIRSHAHHPFEGARKGGGRSEAVALGHIHHGLPGSLAPITVDPDHARTWHRWDICVQFAIQAYRDACWAGDRELLRDTYPVARRALRLLADQDVYGIGLPWIDGGFTYDHWKLRGVIGYVCGIYLAALAALAEMADILGESEDAAWARERLATGRAAFEQHLYNGDQYLLFMRRETAEVEPQSADCGPECACHRESPSLMEESPSLMEEFIGSRLQIRSF